MVNFNFLRSFTGFYSDKLKFKLGKIFSGKKIGSLILLDQEKIIISR